MENKTTNLRRIMMKKFGLAAVIAFLFTFPALSQNNLDNVHLFQSYFYDAPIAKVG